MSQPLLQLRMFDRDKDHALLVDWCNAHGGEVTPAHLLPPLGVGVQMDGEDAAMLFLYYALSAGVCFVDCAATRPKLSLKDSIACFDVAIGYLKGEARHNGYHVMLAHAPAPVARCLSRIGFQTNKEGLVRMFMLTDDN
jgi:hypothetical protein